VNVEKVPTFRIAGLAEIKDVLGRSAPGLSEDFEAAGRNGEVFVWHASHYLEAAG
jgi:hypothetical protein